MRGCQRRASIGLSYFLNRELSGTPQYAIWGSLLQCRPHAELYPLATDRQRKMRSVSILPTSATSNPVVGCTASVERKLHRMRILRPVYLSGSGSWTLTTTATLIILLDSWIFALNSFKSRGTRVQESGGQTPRDGSPGPSVPLNVGRSGL